mgnify:CR=1 FL=1
MKDKTNRFAELAPTNMKLKATLCVNLGLYMDLRPEIEIDTENYEEAKGLIKELHQNFFGLLTEKPEVVFVKPKRDFTKHYDKKAESELVSDLEAGDNDEQAN